MTRKFLLPLLFYGVLTACSSANTNKDWANARTENTVAAYESYIDKHPGDEHAAWARKRIGTLLDDSAWQTAQRANSVDSYLQYLAVEPYGTHAQAARDFFKMSGMRVVSSGTVQSGSRTRTVDNGCGADAARVIGSLQSARH